MAIQLATKTLEAIENCIFSDQGGRFREFQEKVIPHMKDAYQGANEGFRSHLGASVVGKECARQIWYGWRWAKKPSFSGRMLRLFNRGHLEEARFIAMLLSIGCQVYQQDSDGNQYRISELGGHFGGSGDGVVLGIPDVPSGQYCLAEFKTHGEKSFLKLVKDGVKQAKFEHYVQMNVYMRKMGLMYALYGAVNKNTDDLHMEIITLDSFTADQFLDRGRQIVMMRNVPDRIPSASPGLFACKYCDQKDICHFDAPMEKNCRTCFYAHPQENGTWACESKERIASLSDKTNVLTKAQQLKGCDAFYTPI